MKLYALADCNNFFVSCERVFRPDLATSAVVVLSNNDGCAISRSEEAKRLGIGMGQPFYQFAELARQGRVTVFSSNFALYGDMSRRVQMTLREAASSMEVYSIDESFLDLSGMDTDFDMWAKQLSQKCLRNTGIPVSVGVAPTKTLAKIASKLCKHYPRLAGGCYLHRLEDVEKVLRNFPVEDVWGIGRRYAKRFAACGIVTAYDFYCCSQEWVRSRMGVTGERTWRELHLQPCIEFDDYARPKQQICVSRSFAHEIYDVDELSQQVSMFSAMACRKLRRQQSACHAATVFLLTNRHRDDLPQQFDSRIVTFPVASDSTLEINKAILTAMRQLVRNGMGYKKAGVVLSEIVDRGSVQSSLFDTLDRPKHARLMEVMDAINARQGDVAVGVASQSLEGIRMNRNHLSPRYTTRLDEIMVVKSD